LPFYLSAYQDASSFVTRTIPEYWFNPNNQEFYVMVVVMMMIIIIIMSMA
jgi:hypothetical protein